MKFEQAIFLLALLIVTVLFSINPQSAPFVPDLQLQDILGALGGIFVIILLVERATEVFITISRQATTESKELEIPPLEKELKVLEKINADPALIRSKLNELKNAKKRLRKYKRETKQFSFLTGYFLSFIVCASGVGLLGTIIVVSEGSESFIRAVDIMLTSALIAGGSDAYHQFVRALETFFIKSRESMENLAADQQSEET